MKISLLFAVVALSLTGCVGVERSDVPGVRSLELGHGARVLVVEDPGAPVNCYISWSGTSCLPRKEAAGK